MYCAQTNLNISSPLAYLIGISEQPSKVCDDVAAYWLVRLDQIGSSTDFAKSYCCTKIRYLPRINGTLIFGRSRKFLAMWMESLSRKAGEM